MGVVDHAVDDGDQMMGRLLKAAPALVEVLAAASLVTGAASLGTPTL